MVFFVRIKSRNSLLFFLSSIACAMAMTFSSKVSAKITEVRDPESRRIVMRCDDVTEEVAISDDFAEFNQRGELTEAAGKAIQFALRTYMYGRLPKIELPIIIKRDKATFNQDSFYSTYGFIPKKITFANVTYEVDWKPNDDPDKPVVANQMTITSNGGNCIYPPCIMAFGCSPQWEIEAGYQDYVVPGSQNSIVPTVKIIGREFTTIPRGCFYGMYGLEAVDATETSINTIKEDAFKYCELIKRVDLSNSATNYSINNAGIRAFKTVNRRYMYKGGTHRIDYQEVKPDFEGNIRGVLEHQCTTSNEEEERTINERMDDDCFSYACSLCDTCTLL